MVNWQCHNQMVPETPNDVFVNGIEKTLKWSYWGGISPHTALTQALYTVGTSNKSVPVPDMVISCWGW